MSSSATLELLHVLKALIIFRYLQFCLKLIECPFTFRANWDMVLVFPTVQHQVVAGLITQWGPSKDPTTIHCLFIKLLGKRLKKLKLV